MNFLTLTVYLRSFTETEKLNDVVKIGFDHVTRFIGLF